MHMFDYNNYNCTHQNETNKVVPVGCKMMIFSGSFCIVIVHLLQRLYIHLDLKKNWISYEQKMEIYKLSFSFLS